MIVIEFDNPGMTAQQYDEIVQRLEENGLGAPDGRIYHVAAPTEAGWFVVDVWESPEQFNAFGDRLMPIIEAVGASPPTPVIREVHNIID